MSTGDATESAPSSRASSGEPEANNSIGKAASSSKKSSKTSKPRLTASQKNFNHKDAENKRRTAIRERFTELSHMVPGAMGQEKSEQVMLNKTTEYLKQMLEEQRRLEAMADRQGIPIDDAGRLRDDDLGGPTWQPRNMEHYEASKQKRGDGSEQNADDDND
ncbi:hypothetical protein PV05_01636 [Exophiala xenobiotica]|uniref:BHLH domain-containing protein n=1 Tax=Exophiala xenobiotica TaxID=348802 RepID=A0A0D2F3M0_9EURO|nr:uncharacterized protein PV05_01636 [Exophiala xenobiotica]KIW61525.1 hypothetical protein PV05_01636 [Exophiala xenobiotica]